MPQQVTAFAGKFNLSVVNETGSIERSIWKIIVHPDWQQRVQKYDADITIVILRQAVEYSNEIRPICLLKARNDEIKGTGSIVGWGKSHESIGNSVETPNELRIPVIATSKCFADVPDLENFSSDRTFCGGYLNESKATCVGDSGGGLYLYNSNTRHYYLAGIISASMYDFDTQCDIEVYSLFTNVGKFIDWIMQTHEETKKIVWEAVDFDCVRKEVSG